MYFGNHAREKKVGGESKMQEVLENKKEKNKARFWGSNLFKFSILILIPIGAFLFSLVLGRYSISIREIFGILIAKLLGQEIDYPKIIDAVIFQVRIPRIIIAMVVGSALSVAGAVYQGMFKNPMVSPDILGTSAGAGFGAALAILLSFDSVGIQLFAFAFGLMAVLLTYSIANSIGKDGNFMFILILAGILVGTVFQSMISLSKYIADPYDKLPAITFWLMGSLSNVNQQDVLMVLIPFLVGIIPIFLVRWQLNALSFGEEEAKALGVDTKRIRLLVIISSTLITAASISVAGMVGWVGLIIPHLARMVVGPDFKDLIPASALMGGTYLLMVDNISRSMVSMEIPLGILTSIIGAPFFIYLLFRTRKGWN